MTAGGTAVVYDTEVELFLDAWRAWDESPAWAATAAAMVDACKPLAARLGVGVPEFRDRLTVVARRQRNEHPFIDPEAAIAEVLAG